MDKHLTEGSREDMRLHSEYAKEFGEAINSPNTVECVECGYMFYGDEPSIGILCFDCYAKRANSPSGWEK